MPAFTFHDIPGDARVFSGKDRIEICCPLGSSPTLKIYAQTISA